MTTVDTDIETLEARLSAARQKKAAAEQAAAEALHQRREAWAEDVLTCWASDSDDAYDRLEAARQVFARDLSPAAYIDWELRYRVLVALHQRARTACATLGQPQEAFADPHGSYGPPPFLRALDRAVEAALSTVRADVSAQLQAELAALDEA